MAFWQQKSLQEMTTAEWESLCDGCGKCCLHKILYEDTGEIAFTRVGCQLLDPSSCRCRDYSKRFEKVRDCLNLRPENILQTNALPDTCAYLLLANGKDLPAWHPLVSGDAESMHHAGASVRDRFLSEIHVHPDGLEEHIIQWVQAK